jgi:hypothetical protein
MSDHDRFYMGGIVNKQIATLVVVTVILAAVTLADAQQRAKIPKIGWLGIRPDSLTTSVESFRREFYALGHVEGKASLSSIVPLIISSIASQVWPMN